MARRGFLREIILRLDREAARQVREDTEDALEAAGQAGAAALEEAMQAGGQRAARALVRELSRAYDQTIAEARVKLAKGLIDRQEFERIRTQAAQTFDRSLIAGMERLRSEGQLTETQFARLASRLKLVGDAGDDAGKRLHLSWSSVRVAVAGVIAAIAGSRLVSFLRDAASAAIETTRSFLRLAATSKLYGIEQAELNRLARIGREELRLAAGEANSLAATTARFAALAGDASRAQELLTRALDLGAAQGMTAAEVGEALEQTLRGQDEGLDKLIQRNPSQVYEEWAASVGKSVAELTETERRLAIVNALIEAGTRVQGEYGRQLETDVGRLDQWNTFLRNSAERIGGSLIPILVKLADVLQGPLETGVNIMTAFLDRIDRLTSSPLENLIRDLRTAGEESEALVRAELALRRVELAREQRELARRSLLARLPAGGIPGLDPIGVRRAVGTLGAVIMEDLSQATLDALAAQQEKVLALIEDTARKAALAAERGDDVELAALERRLDSLRQYQRGLDEAIRARQRETEITAELADLEKALADLRAGKFPRTGPPPTPPPATPQLPEPRIDVGTSIGPARPVATALETAEERVHRLAEAWLEANADMVGAAERAAMGITGAFQDAFSILFEDFSNVGEAAEAMARSVAGALVGGVADYASSKVSENVALAIENVARGISALALGNAPSATAHFTAAKTHTLAAAKWAILAGAAGAGQAAIAGGTRGGLSGGIPTGARDPSGRLFEERKGPEIHIYIDPLDPYRPAWQEAVYAAHRMATERFGRDATVHVHPMGGRR